MSEEPIAPTAPIVDVICASVLSFDCPNCGEPQGEGFFGDPRGETHECDACGKQYYIPEDVRIDIS